MYGRDMYHNPHFTYIYIIYNKYTDIYIGYPFCGDQMVVVELTSGFWQL